MDVLDNELLNMDETEMSSSIDKLKKSNETAISATDKMKKSNEKIDINSFILDLENNLDNIDNIDNKNNIDNIDKVHEYQHLENNKENNLEKNIENKKNNKECINKQVYTFLINIKEPLIIILLFILLNNKDLNILIDKIPYIDILPDNFLSLLLRGLVLAIIIYYFKKFDN